MGEPSVTRLSSAVMHARILIAAAQDACAAASAISLNSAEIMRACRDLRTDQQSPPDWSR